MNRNRFDIGRRNLLMTTAASILVKWGAADARAAAMTGNVILLGDSRSSTTLPTSPGMPMWSRT